MGDGVQRGKATVSRSVQDCLPICLPSVARHSTFQRTPADDVPAYLAREATRRTSMAWKTSGSSLLSPTCLGGYRIFGRSMHRN